MIVFIFVLFYLLCFLFSVFWFLLSGFCFLFRFLFSLWKEEKQNKTKTKTKTKKTLDNSSDLDVVKQFLDLVHKLILSEPNFKNHFRELGLLDHFVNYTQSFLESANTLKKELEASGSHQTLNLKGHEPLASRLPFFHQYCECIKTLLHQNLSNIEAFRKGYLLLFDLREEGS